MRKRKNFWKRGQKDHLKKACQKALRKKKKKDKGYNICLLHVRRGGCVQWVHHGIGRVK